MNSLTMCSGQGVMLQEKGKEKECVFEDIRCNPHKYQTIIVLS